MSGYRNAESEGDVVADLTREEFGPGYERLRALAHEQVDRRRRMLETYSVRGEQPISITGRRAFFVSKALEDPLAHNAGRGATITIATSSVLQSSSRWTPRRTTS